jgi:hypothetical protein
MGKFVNRYNDTIFGCIIALWCFPIGCCGFVNLAEYGSHIYNMYIFDLFVYKSLFFTGYITFGLLILVGILRFPFDILRWINNNYKKSIGKKNDCL